jgi:hypothetical protein
LGNFDDDVDISRAWESIRKNIKASATYKGKGKGKVVPLLN